MELPPAHPIQTGSRSTVVAAVLGAVAARARQAYWNCTSDERGNWGWQQQSRHCTNGPGSSNSAFPATGKGFKEQEPQHVQHTQSHC